jgi:hypothetical protein
MDGYEVARRLRDVPENARVVADRADRLAKRATTIARDAGFHPPAKPAEPDEPLAIIRSAPHDRGVECRTAPRAGNSATLHRGGRPQSTQRDPASHEISASFGQPAPARKPSRSRR